MKWICSRLFEQCFFGHDRKHHRNQTKLHRGENKHRAILEHARESTTKKGETHFCCCLIYFLHRFRCSPVCRTTIARDTKQKRQPNFCARARDGNFFRIKLLLFNIMMESEINRLVALCEGLTQILYHFDNSRADSDVVQCAVLLLAEVGGGGAWRGSTTNTFAISQTHTIRMALYCCCCGHLFSTGVRASSTFLGALHAQIISPSMGCIRRPHECRTDLHRIQARPRRAKRSSFEFCGFSMANCDT